MKHNLTCLYILCFIIISSLASCDMNSGPVQQSELLANPVNALSLQSEIDTIIMNGDTISFTPNSPLNKKEKIWSTRFVEDSAHHKDDSGYVLGLQNGEQVFLKNVDDEDDITTIKQYDEFANIPQINHWLFHVAHYEWSNYELVDKSDGTITEIMEYPVISPGFDKIILSKQGFDASVEFNGIEFLRVKNNKIEPAWIRELSQICLTEPKWLDNNTVIFKRINLKTRKIDFVKAILN